MTDAGGLLSAMVARSTPQIPIDTLAALLDEAPLISSDELEEITDDEDGYELPTREMHPLQLERLLLHERSTPNEVILLDTPKRRPTEAGDELDTVKLRRGYGFLATCCIGGVALGATLASLFL